MKISTIIMIIIILTSLIITGCAAADENSPAFGFEEIDADSGSVQASDSAASQDLTTGDATT